MLLTITAIVTLVISGFTLWEIAMRKLRSFFIGNFDSRYAPAMFVLSAAMIYASLCVLGVVPANGVAQVAAVAVLAGMGYALLMVIKDALELMQFDWLGLVVGLLILIVHGAPIATAVGVFFV